MRRLLILWAVTALLVGVLLGLPWFSACRVPIDASE